MDMSDNATLLFTFHSVVLQTGRLIWKEKSEDLAPISSRRFYLDQSIVNVATFTFIRLPISFSDSKNIHD